MRIKIRGTETEKIQETQTDEIQKTEGQDGIVQCNNCHEWLGPDEKFCRKCGTKRGEGIFEPIDNIMQCVYGPEPVMRIHTCRQCHYKWTNIVMIDDDRYCPKCGSSDVEVTEERAWD